MELQVSTIENKIYEIRGRRVMLDIDLAEMYNVETGMLKRAVRRNMERFPADFMFELSNDEYNDLKIRLRCQFGILESRGKYPISSLCFYRTGRSHAIRRITFSYCRPSKHQYHASLCI